MNTSVTFNWDSNWDGVKWSSVQLCSDPLTTSNHGTDVYNMIVSNKINVVNVFIWIVFHPNLIPFFYFFLNFFVFLPCANFFLLSFMFTWSYLFVIFLWVIFLNDNKWYLFVFFSFYYKKSRECNFLKSFERYDIQINVPSWVRR